MARTKNTPMEPAGMPEILPAVTARIEAAQDAARTPAEIADIYALGEAAGSAKAFGFIATVATSAEVAQYEKVKKSKAWRFLASPKVATHRNFESLDEYCEAAFGKSYRRMQELSGNARLLGNEAYEQAESIGLRQVDYNAIKALPAPDKELVRRAVEETQSREEVITLIEELATRSAQQHIDADKKLAESKAEHAAVAKRLEVVSKQKDDAEARAARIAVAPPDEALAELHEEAVGVLNDALGAIRGRMRQALTALQHHDQDNGPFMAGLVSQLQAELQVLRDEFNLPDAVGDGTPAWKAWASQQDGAALSQ